jgi:hypothetical protein
MRIGRDCLLGKQFKGGPVEFSKEKLDSRVAKVSLFMLRIDINIIKSL